MAFRKGPDVNPFAGASQEPMKLLEAMTAVELASCVPRVKITKIDARGRAATDVRPMMFELIETPNLSGNSFGLSSDQMMERASVSLDSLQVKTKLSYGVMAFKEVTLRFTVHRPNIVFDRNSSISWKEILEEGKSFSLEYGWVADPVIVKNDLFNGLGHVTPNGLVIKSTQTVLLCVAKYGVELRGDGTVAVTVEAFENGEIALREARLDEGESALKRHLDKLPQLQIKNRGTFVTVGDIMDLIVAPMVVRASNEFGYPAQPELILGNFNRRAMVQSPKHGGRDMEGRSIADCLLSFNQLRDTLTNHVKLGRAMSLRNFIDIILNMISSADTWGDDRRPDRQKPLLVLKTDTINDRNGMRLVMVIYDRVGITDVFRGSDRLPLDRQTRADIMKVLNEKDVPVLEFGRAGSVIIDANFNAEIDGLLRSDLIERADSARKDRVQIAQTPDVDSRMGEAAPRDIVPVSVLEGEATMQGNFVFESFGLVWVDFFGSSAISGVFHVLEKDDSIEAGKFTSVVRFISEGLDPLNTRQKRTLTEDGHEKRHISHSSTGRK